MVRVVGVLVVLVLATGTARADWWSVDIPPGWYGFSLPEARATLDRVRKQPGVKQAEIRMYQATDTVLAIYLIDSDGVSDLQRDDLEKYDRLIGHNMTGALSARLLEYDTDWVDDQLVAKQIDEGQALTSTTRRITAVGGGDRVHMLIVSCFALKGAAGTVCSRIQESAKVTLPDQVSPPEHRSLGMMLLIGVGALLGLFALYAIFRPKHGDNRSAPAPMRAAAPYVPLADRAKAPTMPPRTDAAAPARRARAPSSIPLDVDPHEPD